jgi:hypothetical protein
MYQKSVNSSSQDSANSRLCSQDFCGSTHAAVVAGRNPIARGAHDVLADLHRGIRHAEDSIVCGRGHETANIKADSKTARKRIVFRAISSISLNLSPQRAYSPAIELFAVVFENPLVFT